MAATLAGVAGCTPSAPREPAPHGEIVVPGTLADASDVDAGPSADRDHDGIADEDDACPDESGIASADPARNGCSPPVVIVCLSIVAPPKVTFARGDVAIAEEHALTLDETAATLRDNPQITELEIEGHTDPTEDARLGMKRAEAVKRELVRRGVAEGRLTTTNAGASRPVEANTTAEGRAKNRRVELRVVSPP